MTNISPRQLELHRDKTASVAHAIEERALADVLDLGRYADSSFDVTVAYGRTRELRGGARRRGRFAAPARDTAGRPRAHHVHVASRRRTGVLLVLPELIERFGWDVRS